MNWAGMADTLFVTRSETKVRKRENTLTNLEQNDDGRPCPYQRTRSLSPNRSPRKPTWLRTLALAGWRVSAFARAGVCTSEAILGAISSTREFDDDRARMYTHHGTTASTTDTANDLDKHCRAGSRIFSLFAGAFDTVDGTILEVSNAKVAYCGGELTHLTDLTVNRMGVYVPPARARSRPPARPLGLLPTPSADGVKSVKSVKSQDVSGVISPPCRQTRCQFDGNAGSGVVA